MSRSVSLGGLLIALGAAAAAYGHYCDPNIAAIFSAVGALLASIGRSLLAPAATNTNTPQKLPKTDELQTKETRQIL